MGFVFILLFFVSITFLIGQTRGEIRRRDKLFDEINYSLERGHINDDLIKNLHSAMRLEPDNVNIPSTIGSIYEQLYQKALTEGDSELSNRYFQNAKFYVDRALKINPGYFDAVYMMGALEYNKAVELAKELNELADDYSNEGTKKYNEKQAEMMWQFEKALPFFEKAKELNPDDSNTLLALHEIWARKGIFERNNDDKAKDDDRDQVVSIIEMEEQDGVFLMPCVVNGLPLKFIYDTGASDVSISLTEALFMLKNGYLSLQDMIGIEYYMIANGEIIEGTEINLKSVRIGNVNLSDIKASIKHDLHAPLLLGQSALSQLGIIEFDYAKNTLTIKSKG